MSYGYDGEDPDERVYAAQVTVWSSLLNDQIPAYGWPRFADSDQRHASRDVEVLLGELLSRSPRWRAS